METLQSKMSRGQDHIEGSVLTQKTVLGFSSHPPSPYGSSHIPQCVTEQRGGQHNFAMNQHTQLQFNLGIPPSPANLATHFDPSHPTPIVIEKTIGGSGEVFRAVSAKKLALAVRMAKRDLKLQQRQLMAPSHLCPQCRSAQATPQQSLCDGDNSALPVPQTPSPNTSHTEQEDTEQPLPQRTSLHSSTQPVPVAELSLIDKKGNQKVDDGASQEVIRLRKELQRQVNYLKQLRELGHTNVVSSQRRGVGKRGRERVESGRVWMEDVKGEEEKMLQRKEEQATRNARIIYNLSQQVSHLQQELQRLRLTDKPATTKKSQAFRKLAAIHRSAIRLMQNYQGPGHTHQPLPPELGLLLQQLSLLSHHFGVGGANSELAATLKLLQELIEEGRDSSRQSFKTNKENYTPQKPAPQQRRMNPVRTAKKTRVLLHPKSKPMGTRRGRAGHPHFAQQTMSSQRRQQTRQPAYSSLKHPPTMLHSTPLTLQTHKEKQQLKSAKKHCLEAPLSMGNTVPPPSSPSLHLVRDSSPTPDKTTSTVAQLHLVSPTTDIATSTAAPSSPTTEQRLWMEGVSASLAHQSEQLERLNRVTQKQLGQLQHKLSSQLKAKKTSSPPKRGESPKPEPESPSYDREQLQGLVERLRELEGEEELIRERWRTIAYEDPLLAKPHIVHRSEEKSPEENVSPHTSMSDEARQRVERYRQQFQHHLHLTGHSTEGGFNPWKMAEKLTDDLLSEVVDEVAEELGQLCDGYVDGLFSDEFAKPPPCN